MLAAMFGTAKFNVGTTLVAREHFTGNIVDIHRIGLRFTFSVWEYYIDTKRDGFRVERVRGIGIVL